MKLPCGVQWRWLMTWFFKLMGTGLTGSLLKQRSIFKARLEQAQEKGINARSATLHMSQIARAIEWGYDLGFYRMVVDNDTDKILGATLVGYEAAEIVHVFLDLIEAGATWQLLERSVHIHPTYAEALPSLARLLYTPRT